MKIAEHKIICNFAETEIWKVLKNEGMGSLGRKRGVCGQVCPLPLRSDPAGKSMGSHVDLFPFYGLLQSPGKFSVVIKLVDLNICGGLSLGRM